MLAICGAVVSGASGPSVNHSGAVHQRRGGRARGVVGHAGAGAFVEAPIRGQPGFRPCELGRRWRPGFPAGCAPHSRGAARRVRRRTDPSGSLSRPISSGLAWSLHRHVLGDVIAEDRHGRAVQIDADAATGCRAAAPVVGDRDVMPAAYPAAQVGIGRHDHPGAGAVVAQLHENRAVEEHQAILTGLADNRLAARHRLRPHPRFDRQRRIRRAIAEAQRRCVGDVHIIIDAVERDVVRRIWHRRVLDQDHHGRRGDVIDRIPRFSRQRMRAIGHTGRVPHQRIGRRQDRRTQHHTIHPEGDTDDAKIVRRRGIDRDSAGRGSRGWRDERDRGRLHVARCRQRGEVHRRRRAKVISPVACVDRELVQRLRRKSCQLNCVCRADRRAIDVCAWTRRLRVRRPRPATVSSVVNVMVAPLAVTFETRRLLICGAVVSGASGPSGAQAVPPISTAPLSFGESSAEATPAPSLKRQ